MKFLRSRLFVIALFVCLFGLDARPIFARTVAAPAINSTSQNRTVDKASVPINNLTLVTVQQEDAPFFTLIWKDSPKGKEAAVDVYFYDSAGQRIPAAMNKWDNSGWLDHSLLLCRDCGTRMIEIPEIGQVNIPQTMTLFELVWHGKDENGQPQEISTFGTIDPQLGWALVNTGSQSVPAANSSDWRVAPLEQGSFSSVSVLSVMLLMLTLMLMTVSAVGYGWWIGQSSD